MIKVLVADDHPAVRVGVRAVLEADGGVRVVGEAGTVGEVRAALEGGSVDVVVLDVRLADGDGLDLTGELRETGTEAVVYTQYTNDRTVLRAFRSGALGYVVKESDPSVLVRAVRQAAAHLVAIDPGIADKVVAAATKRSVAKAPFNLTPQEWAVVELLPRSLTNVQIARALNLSPEMITSHLRKALPKMKATDRDSAVAIMRESGLV